VFFFIPKFQADLLIIRLTVWLQSISSGFAAAPAHLPATHNNIPPVRAVAAICTQLNSHFYQH
jgi:hypothetical protein